MLSFTKWHLSNEERIIWQKGGSYYRGELLYKCFLKLKEIVALCQVESSI